MRYLLDTCTVSYIIKNSYPKLQEHLTNHCESDLAISTITQAELIYGIKKKPSKKTEHALEGFFELVHILPFDSACAFTYGKMRANYEKKGISLGALDGLIAAHAITEKRILITKDKAFSFINELKVEDWTV